jgi:urease accessory protein UreE
MMHMFKSLPVAYEVHRLEAVPRRAQAYPLVGVTLGWDERLKARGRRRTDEGLEFATTLGRGTVLRAGDCFVLDAPEVVIRVIEKEESVFVITPATPREFALFAYLIGNSHQPVMLTATEIVCVDVPGMEQVLDYHGIVFVRARRAFTPVGQSLDHHRQGSQ